MDARAHWEQVYATKDPQRVSWFRPHLERSLELIERAAPDRGASILDVGAGQSTLVDDLLARGYHNITVLEISRAALDGLNERVGEAGAAVRWRCGNPTTSGDPRGCDSGLDGLRPRTRPRTTAPLRGLGSAMQTPLVLVAARVRRSVGGEGTAGDR